MDGLLKNTGQETISYKRTGYHWGKDDPLLCLKQAPFFL
jgi:hypothetical protein